jgi:hypothetical protein
MTPLRRYAFETARQLNHVLGRTGVRLVRTGPRPFEEFRDYIPFRETIEAASAAGLAVGDYIERRHGTRGSTQETIERLKAAGVLKDGIRRVCEIGPGSGRYLTRTLEVCRPDHYEIYETADEWREYLVRTYRVVARPADGLSLSATPSASVDLVQAHKVFPGVPLLATLRYLCEMVRVASGTGSVVFDMVTEPCMDEALVERWLSSGASYQYYPSMIPRQYLIDFFDRRGFSCTASFLVPMDPGITECFAFTRRSAPAA